MQRIKDNKTLTEAIAFYENKKKSELGLIKQHFDFTVDSLNPINVIKEKITSAVNSPGIKGKIFSTLFNLGTGMVTKNLLIGSSLNPIKKIAVTLLQTQVKKLVDNPPTDVKDKSISFVQDMLQKLKIK
ncbi:hypothetical protein [Flavobacterium sp.]|uniref:hypothetical protein n=1 Tax=Flavobacterium sp. TaxID=239 RepID=UPI003753736F